MKQALHFQKLILVITAVRTYLDLKSVFFFLVFCFYCDEAPHYKGKKRGKGTETKPIIV